MSSTLVALLQDRMKSARQRSVKSSYPALSMTISTIWFDTWRLLQTREDWSTRIRSTKDWSWSRVFPVADCLLPAEIDRSHLNKVHKSERWYTKFRSGNKLQLSKMVENSSFINVRFYCVVLYQFHTLYLFLVIVVENCRNNFYAKLRKIVNCFEVFLKFLQFVNKTSWLSS